MSRSWSTFLMIAFLIGGAAPRVRCEAPSPAILPQRVAAARIKRLGDGLPPGAIARLGKRADPGYFMTVIWSPHGKMLASAGFLNPIRVWDVATGKETRRFAGCEDQVFAWSPDGKTLASGWSTKGTAIHLWDVMTGKEVRRLVDHDAKWQNYYFDSIAWSPDGTTLASSSFVEKSVRLWDVATGNEIRRLVGHAGHVQSLAWSPDGRLLASGSDDETIRLWNPGTGKEIRRLTSAERDVSVVAWSPDGTMLASAARGKFIYLWDARTGKQVRELGGHHDWVSSVAWSPDGKKLASADYDTLHVWEATTWRECRSFLGDRNKIGAVAWSPDSMRIASVGDNGPTILIWAIGDHAGETATVAELPSLWADLASEDAAKAYLAICKLTRDARHSVPFMAERLKPVPVPDQKRVCRLIEDLDDKRFSVRQMATHELEKLGELAEPALRRELAEKPSLEVRQRIELLLARIEQPSAEFLQGLRAIEVLEHIGSADAKQVLQRLGAGPEGCRLTREARASVDRLSKRATAAR
jgi:Tol biopolymer transport system component